MNLNVYHISNEGIIFINHTVIFIKENIFQSIRLQREIIKIDRYPSICKL